MLSVTRSDYVKNSAFVIARFYFSQKERIAKIPKFEKSCEKNLLISWHN